MTNIAGTTRDIVEGSISIDGILFNIIDTAGIRETSDVVESIGVKKSLDLINDADLILYVLNNNEPLQKEDFEVIERIKNKNYIIVINKIDLETKLDKNKINNYVEISIKDDIGIDNLKDKIKEVFNFDKIEQDDFTYLSSARSISLLKNALTSLEAVRQAIKDNMPIDMVEIDLKNVWNVLGEIIGETYKDELIDQLFSQFCLGK